MEHKYSLQSSSSAQKIKRRDFKKPHKNQHSHPAKNECNEQSKMTMMMIITTVTTTIITVTIIIIIIMIMTIIITLILVCY